MKIPIFNFQFSKKKFISTPKNFSGMSLQSRGFSLVEVVMMIFVATIVIFAIWRIYVFYIKISVSNPANFVASFLAEEGIEAIKFMRDGGWNTNINSLATNTPYALILESSGWKATTTPAFILSQFDRRFYLYDVFRDGSGNIAETGTFDANTREVVVEVSWWKENATTTKNITTYVSNIFNN